MRFIVLPRGLTGAVTTPNVEISPPAGVAVFDGLVPEVNIAGEVQRPAYFVSKTGDDTDGKTEATAFRTVPQARDAMRGDGTRNRVYIRDGTYNFTSALSLTSADTLTEWLAYPGEAPIIDGQNNDITLIDADGADDLTFQGIKFVNTDDPVKQSGVINDAGIGLTNCLRATVESCGFDATYQGITLKGNSHDAKLLGNTLDNIHWTPIRVFDGPNDGVAAGNTGDNISTDGPGRGTGHAFFSGRDIQGWVIEYNTITNCQYIGIAFGGVGNDHSGNTIRFNVISGYGQRLDDGGAIYTLGRTGIFGATFIIDSNWCENGGSEALPHAKAVYLDDGTAGALIRNNVSVNGHQGFTQNHGGNDIQWFNNIALLRIGADQSHFEAVQYGLFNQNGGAHDIGTLRNEFKRNILVAVDANDDLPASYGNVDWIRNSGVVNIPEASDNILFDDMDTISGETSSQQTDPLFDNFDPANKILELNASSPAYTEGFVDIAGVTDGGAFTWGIAGYDRANY